MFPNTLVFAISLSLSFGSLLIAQSDLPVTSGLVVHYDVDDLSHLADGDSVTQWNDLSGNANHADTPVPGISPGFLIRDRFADGSVGNGADDSDIAWWSNNMNRGGEISVVNGEMVIDSGDSSANESFTVWSAVFGQALDFSAAQNGDTITLRFDFALAGTIDNAGRQFGFGLQDTKGTIQEGANLGSPSDNRDDRFYAVKLATGTSTDSALTAYEAQTPDDQPVAIPGLVRDTDETDLTTFSYGINDTNSHSVEYVLTKNGSGFDFTVSIDGSQVATTTVASPLTNRFDGIRFTFATSDSSSDDEFTIDDVEVLSSFVSHPSTPELDLPTYHSDGFNGQPAVRFNGNQGIMHDGAIGLTSGVPYTVFIVMNQTSEGTSRPFQFGGGFGGSTSGTSVAIQSAYTNTSVRFNNGNRSFADTSINFSPVLLTTRRGSGEPHNDVELWINDVAQTATGASNGFNTLTLKDEILLLGAGLDSPGEDLTSRYTGNIAEIAIYNRELSNVEVADVQTHLLQKRSLGFPTSVPNILMVMADDWGWPHAGAYGESWVYTPTFDSIANQGVLFANGFTNSPSCTPSRNAAFTGRYPWTLAEGGTLWGSLPPQFRTYTEVLGEAGYFVGHTGKGFGPGDLAATGREVDPAGFEYNDITKTPPASKMNNSDYVENFKAMLDSLQPGQPFCFWYGPTEPHRGYQLNVAQEPGNLGVTNGQLADVHVPEFFVDNSTVRGDMLDYAFEINYLDEQLGLMLAELSNRGMLADTLIIVTGDHGMPFPRAKTQMYEWGIHVPFAVRWDNGITTTGRTVTDLVSFIDLAPTFLEASGITPPEDMIMHGKSFLNVLQSGSSGLVDSTRDFVVTGVERHGNGQNETFMGETLSHAGYPMRALRDEEFLYVRNYQPTWTVMGGDGGPTRDEMKALSTSDPLYEIYLGERAGEELYNVVNDPDCVDDLLLTNSFDKPANNLTPAQVEAIRARMSADLDTKLREHRDPRGLGFGQIAFSNFGNGFGTTLEWLTSVVEYLLADDDLDGVENIVEIVLVEDILPEGVAPLAAYPDGDGNAVLDYTRSRDQFENAMFKERVYWSTDLLTWNADSMTTTVTEQNATYEKARVTVPTSGADTFFFRIEANFRSTNVLGADQVALTIPVVLPLE